MILCENALFKDSKSYKTIGMHLIDKIKSSLIFIQILKKAARFKENYIRFIFPFKHDFTSSE